MYHNGNESNIFAWELESKCITILKTVRNMPKLPAKIAQEYDQMFLVKKLFTMIKNKYTQQMWNIFTTFAVYSLIILCELKSRGQ